MKLPRRRLYLLPIVLVVAAMVATACGSSGGSGSNTSANTTAAASPGSTASTGGGSGSGTLSTEKVTIRAMLPPNSGDINSSQNAALKKYTAEYTKNHPNVTVNWLPNAQSSITTSNAQVISQAAGGAAPDVIWEQYNPLLSGSIPQGLLQNLKSYLEKPNPYVPGNTKWLDIWQPITVPYMTSPGGEMQILLMSNVETGFFYNKAAFTKAGITATPTSWAEFVQDLGKLKSAGYTPLMFATGGICNPSWYERLASSQFLHSSLSKFMVDKQVVTSGKDVVSGIEKGIISMKNPAYAQVWKQLYDLKPYLASGASSYAACANPGTTKPPLSAQTLLIKGQVAILWGGSWYIPQLDQAGFTGKFGVFPEPPITTATSQYAAGLDTRGVIGGPNGDGQWSITSQKADKSMTPQKTDVVMDFMMWLFTPPHASELVTDWGQGGGDIPAIQGAKAPAVPGLASLVPSKQPPTIVDVALDSVLSTNTTNTGQRMIEQLVAGGISWDSFVTQWDQLLQQGAQDYAKTNNLDLSKFK